MDQTAEMVLTEYSFYQYNASPQSKISFLRALLLEMCSCKLQEYVGLPNMHLHILKNTQVSDLVELTKQQAVTIRRLEKDSLAKSDRIADIETRCLQF